MKANQAFKNDNEAVSPVIATILMVAITVVLAATVYVWVGGFSANQQHSAPTISLASDGPIADGVKSYTVSAATFGLKWNDLRVTIDGVEQTIDETAACPAAASTKFVVCHGATTEAAADTINGGDTLKINAAPHQTLRILDVASNSVIMTLNIG